MHRLIGARLYGILFLRSLPLFPLLYFFVSLLTSYTVTFCHFLLGVCTGLLVCFLSLLSSILFLLPHYPTTTLSQVLTCFDSLLLSLYTISFIHVCSLPPSIVLIPMFPVFILPSSFFSLFFIIPVPSAILIVP